MLKMSELEKNLNIVKDYLNETITNANNELSDHFKSTFIGALIEPIFRLLIGPEQTRKTIEMLDKILSFSKVFTGNFEIIEDRLDEILALDPIFQVLRKSSNVHSEAINFLKDSYRNRIKFYHILMNGTGTNWQELYKTAFNNKENLIDNLKPEIEALDNLKNLIKKNRRLINVPGLIRADIIDAMVFIQEYTKKNLLSIPEVVF